jgi:hypothetical protein
LFSIHYFRIAHGSFMQGGFRSLGVEIADAIYSPYRADTARIEARMTLK